jgi:hypothetical protein
MSIFLVIRTLDVDYVAKDASIVQASFDSGAMTKVPKTDTVGTYELLIPDGTKAISIHIAQKTFWDIDQTLTLAPGPPPSLSFDGAQVLNIRNLDAHTRGADFNVEVFAVLGQLKDATDDMEAKIKGFGWDPGLNEQQMMTPGSPILTPGGGDGFDRLNFEKSAVFPTGKLFFVLRTVTPQLLGVYRPSSMETHPTVDPQLEPMDYHLFFHPTITADFGPKYPSGYRYLDLLLRYMVYPWVKKDNAGIDPYHGKQMIHQHETEGSGKMIFIFPVGSANGQLGNITSQTEMLHLLKEIGYFIQRMDDVRYPLQPVGKVALSCFSAGIRHLRNVFASSKNDLFHDVHLKEIYVFDGVFAPDPDDTLRHSFIRLLLNWWQSGKEDRTFRVYTQSLSYWNDLVAHVQGGTQTKGAENSKEIDSDRASILFAPSEKYWHPIHHDKDHFKDMDFWFVHQLIPCLFMTDAIRRNSF